MKNTTLNDLTQFHNDTIDRRLNPFREELRHIPIAFILTPTNGTVLEFVFYHFEHGQHWISPSRLPN